MTFARSLDPVGFGDHTITRVTQSRQEDIDAGQSTEIGQKWTVPYGLYRANVFFSAGLAARTGVTGEDLGVLWRALATMFEHDRSAARGMMTTCGLWVFSHPTAHGVAPARQLDRRINVVRHAETPPRRLEDYTRTVADSSLPDGIELTTVVDLWES